MGEESGRTWRITSAISAHLLCKCRTGLQPAAVAGVICLSALMNCDLQVMDWYAGAVEEISGRGGSGAR